MQPALRNLGASFHGVSARTAATLLVTLAFVAVVTVYALGAGRRIADLGARRDEARQSRSDTAGIAGDTADAFRRFRAMLHPGDRFALLFGAGIDDPGFYRLISLSYLYPAIAVTDARDAQAVMVFGRPSRSLRAAFAEVATVDGVWLARRR